jgi:uncharacterized Fe-S center protein
MSDVYLVKYGSRFFLNSIAKGFSEILDIPKDRLFTAVKVHFGEKGNLTFIPPLWIKPIIDILKDRKLKTFLTETSVIYPGPRSNAVDHIELASTHGWGLLNVPIILADGLKGNAVHHYETSKILKYLKVVHVPDILRECDNLVVCSHVKGHMITGYAGAIKNIGMGLVPPLTKINIHETTKFYVDKERCVGCGICTNYCSRQAIELRDDAKAEIDLNKCVSCGDCMVNCPKRAIETKEMATEGTMQQKLVEATKVIVTLANLAGRVYYVNYLMNITPDCDCIDCSKEFIAPNLGVLISKDLVAIEQASYDLVKAYTPTAFKPAVGPLQQIEYAEELQLGSRKYTLKEV